MCARSTLTHKAIASFWTVTGFTVNYGRCSHSSPPPPPPRHESRRFYGLCHANRRDECRPTRVTGDGADVPAARRRRADAVTCDRYTPAYRLRVIVGGSAARRRALGTSAGQRLRSVLSFAGYSVAVKVTQHPVDGWYFLRPDARGAVDGDSPMYPVRRCICLTAKLHVFAYRRECVTNCNNICRYGDCFQNAYC